MRVAYIGIEVHDHSLYVHPAVILVAFIATEALSFSIPQQENTMFCSECVGHGDEQCMVTQYRHVVHVCVRSHAHIHGNMRILWGC